MKTKKLLPLVMVASLATAAFPVVSNAASEDLINIKSGEYVNYQSKVSAYSDENATIGYEDWGITASYSSGWDSNNGIKIDVTDLVAGKSGTFDFTMNFTCWAWGEEDPIPDYRKVNVFFETEDGTTTVALGPTNLTDVSDNTAPVSGSTEFSAPDSTVYLCITQPSGSHQYKNLKLTYTATEGDSQDPEEPSDAVTLFTHTEGTVWDSYSVYDESVLGDGYNVNNYYNNLDISFGNDWNYNNGFKLDVTEYVAGKSGEFGVSVELGSYSWGDININKASVFFETESGVKTAIAEGPDSSADVSDNAAIISGSTEYTAPDEKVYLCITQPGGYLSLHSVELTYIAGESTVEPEEPELPTEQVVVVDTATGEDINGTGAYADETAAYFVVTVTPDGGSYDTMTVNATVKEAVNGNSEASAQKEITTISGESSCVIGIIINTVKDNVDSLTVTLK